MPRAVIHPLPAAGLLSQECNVAPATEGLDTGVSPWRWWVIAGVSYVSLLMLEYSSPIIDSIYPADAVYMFLVTDDIIFNGGKISDWYLSAHFLLFPDAVGSIVAVALSKVGIPALIGGLLVFSLPPILLLAAALRLLMRRSVAVVMAISSITWCTLLALGNSFMASIPQSRFPINHFAAAWQVFVPGLHGGAFFTGWACFLVLYHLLTTPHLSRTSVRLLGGTGVVLVSAAMFSDQIFLPWGLAPLSVVIVWFGRHRSVRRSVLVLTGLWLAAAVGYVASLLPEHTFSASYLAAASGSPGASISAILSYLKAGLFLADPIKPLFLFSNAALLICGAVAFFRRTGPQARLPLGALLVFAGSASVLSVAAAALGGLFEKGEVRYLIPYLVLGPLFVLLAAGSLLWKYLPPARVQQWLSGGAAVCAVAALWFAASGRGPAAVALKNCLLQEHLLVGLADYWDAAPILAASDYRVHVVPMVPGTLSHPFRWMTKKEWMQRTARDNVPVDLRFLIARKGVDAMARAKYGTPLKEISCAQRTIYVYAAGVLENSNLPTTH
jgi:hypothetical protein